MSKVTIPEPLAWPFVSQELESQIEAYAAAKVEEALEEAINLSSMYGATIELDAAIRSLIPEQ